MPKLKDLCTKASSNIRQSDLESRDGDYPVYGAAGFIKNVDFYAREKPYVAVVKDGAGVGRVMYLPAFSSVTGTMQYIIPNTGTNARYLAYAMDFLDLSRYHMGATIPHIYFKDYREEELPFHSEQEQNYIASVLERIDGLICLRQRQLAKLDELVKAQFIEMFGSPIENQKRFPICPIGTFTNILTGATPSRKNSAYYNNGAIPWVKTGEIEQRYIESTEEYITDLALQETNCKLCPVDTVMVAMYGQGRTRGQSGILRIEAATNQACAAILPCPELNPIFLHHFLMNDYKRLRQLGRGVQQENLNLSMIKNYPIMVPPLDLQERFAAFVAQSDKAKSEIRRSLEKMQGLKKACMREFFG